MFSHFDGVRLMSDVVPGMPEGPYPDDWAAVHHMIDEGWMYSLRFDDGVTSAGFLLTPRGAAALTARARQRCAERCGATLLDRYPTIASGVRRRDAAHADRVSAAHPASPDARGGRALGDDAARVRVRRSAVLDGDRVGSARRRAAGARVRVSGATTGASRISKRSTRYDAALSAEADQIDCVVAGAYEAMAHFDLFAAQAMLYFATVSFAEVSQRLAPDESAAWEGFSASVIRCWSRLPRESLRRLRQITQAPRRNRAAPQERARLRGVDRSSRSRRATSRGWPTRRGGISIRWISMR